MESRISSLVPGARIVGQAVTIDFVSTKESVAPVVCYEAIDSSQTGEVLILGAHGYAGCAVWDRLFGVAAQARGISGVVIDGLCRDAGALKEMGLPVFCRGTSPLSIRGRLRASALNAPLLCGGVLVTPGDVICADDDGSAVIHPAEVSQVLQTAEKLRDLELELGRDLSSGSTLHDAFAQHGRLGSLRMLSGGRLDG